MVMEFRVRLIVSEQPLIFRKVTFIWNVNGHSLLLERLDDE